MNFYQLKLQLQNLWTEQGTRYPGRSFSLQLYGVYTQTPRKVLVLKHGTPLAQLLFFDSGEIRLYPRNEQEPEQINFAVPQNVSETDPLPGFLEQAVRECFPDWFRHVPSEDGQGRQEPDADTEPQP